MRLTAVRFSANFARSNCNRNEAKVVQPRQVPIQPLFRCVHPLYLAIRAHRLYVSEFAGVNFIVPINRYYPLV